MTAMLMIQRIEGDKVQTLFYGPEAGSVSHVGAGINAARSAAMKKNWEIRRAKQAAKDAKKK